MRFIDACNRRPVDKTPVWFMRQAGRSLPEYRKLRESNDILQAIKNPEIAYEITMQPVRRHKVDAAILFSDIIVPLAALDPTMTIVPGKGPVISKPFRSSSDLSRLRQLEPTEDIPYVIETVKELAKSPVPLIGFAGAPFTLASYLIEGGPSRDHRNTKALMAQDPVLFEKLLDILAGITLTFLKTQIDAGAQAIQLFDSWVGTLSEYHYRKHILRTTQAILGAIEVPTIHYSLGTSHLLSAIVETQPSVLSLDWRVPLLRTRSDFGDRFAIQGNLDPTILLAPSQIINKEVNRTLEEAGTAPGYIFNLGHGVLPETDPQVLTNIVEWVHEYGLSGDSLSGDSLSGDSLSGDSLSGESSSPVPSGCSDGS